MTYNVGYFVGSLSSTSINRTLSKALIGVAPDDLKFTEIPIGNLPLYSQDYDEDYPAEARALKQAIESSDAILFVSPEFNRSIPAAFKNAIDWASRPWGQNSFDHLPAAIIGASIGVIETAVAQQSLRGVLAFCNMRQMTAPEAYIHFTPEVFQEGRHDHERKHCRVPWPRHKLPRRVRHLPDPTREDATPSNWGGSRTPLVDLPPRHRASHLPPRRRGARQ